MVVPTRNFAPVIADRLEKLLRQIEASGIAPWEILVIDDESEDATYAEVMAFARGVENAFLLRNPASLGCGYTIRHGVALARGARILVAGPWADPPPGLLPMMVDPIDRGVEIVVARPGRAEERPVPPVRIRQEILSRSIAIPLRLLAQDRAVKQPPPFWCFERRTASEIFRRQRINGPAFGVEILYLARRYGYLVHEIGIPRAAGVDPAALPWTDEGIGLGEMVRIRMHRMRGHYG